MAENVLAYLELDTEPCDAPRWRVEQEYRGAAGRIREALQAFGYYEPGITAALTFDEACWHARFEVLLGEPVRIRTLDVALEGEAETDPPFAAALAEAGLATGAVIAKEDASIPVLKAEQTHEFAIEAKGRKIVAWRYTRK